ncbi:MAG: hypothetical protein JSU68_04465 [Phycisphaerales bacterium]|nr:MAG: hypothetical protein JSU68_04465 [Phycisphaerales bacterium]
MRRERLWGILFLMLSPVAGLSGWVVGRLPAFDPEINSFAFFWLFVFIGAVQMLRSVNRGLKVVFAFILLGLLGAAMLHSAAVFAGGGTISGIGHASILGFFGIMIGIPIIGLATLGAFISVMAYIALGSGRKARRRARRVCSECGYDLRGLTTARCPECGTPFDARFLPKPIVPPQPRDT